MGNIVRALDLRLPPGKSAFLWGPRRVGKSFWIRETFPESPLIDLLQSDVFEEYASRPALLRERFGERNGPLVIIDEVQKLPQLLDEVHWLIENRKRSFLLTGSSARKLRRGHANLLAGRAWRRHMMPLCAAELPDLDLERAMVSGLLPPHYLSSHPLEELRAYVGDYLREEVAGEAAVRSLPSFAEFLRVAALTTSELLNYANVARETGVSPKVVRTYFDILEDTWLGFRVAPWRRVKRRRLIETEKFYLFDVGVSNYLARRRPVPGSFEFGKSFEHWVLMELRAWQAYRQPDVEISFWRTAGGQEVDFIIGDMELAVEIKGSARVHEGDLRSLVALREEWKVRRAVVVSLERTARRTDDGIEVLPWRVFVDRLWAGDLGV
ncbi:MAG: ATP-binding protein [Vicinamibacteraceae bacterium]